MEALFLKILNMSLTASYVILAVLLVRALLNRAPKKYVYALWSVVGFRLCCPVSFQSVFSLFRLKPFNMTAAQMASGGAALDYVPENIGMMAQPQITVGIPAANAALADSLPAAAPAASVNPMQIVMALAMAVWCAGILVLLLYSMISLVRLRLRLRTAIRLEENIYQSESVCSPFVLGIFRPRIYLPFGLDAQTQAYVLAHERYHIRHFDHLVKLFAFALLCLHWFNPLCWLAFVLMSRDMEMRCDEWVLGTQADMRRAYTTTLLSFGANRRFPAPSPLAFGESGVRIRIKNALRWKRPKLWLSVLAAALCIAAAAACAANPRAEFSLASPLGKQFHVDDIVFDAPYYSFSYTPETAPQYRLTEDGSLLSGLSGHAADFAQIEWTNLGYAEEVKLTKDCFDRYFYDADGVSGWKNGSGVSAAKLRRANQSAWRILRLTDNFTEVYLLLQQNNGDFYLAYGYYDTEGEYDSESDDSSFRWVFRLEQDERDDVSTAGVGGVDMPDVADAHAEQQTYVSDFCIYLSPLSSRFYGPDSGYRYHFAQDEFTLESRNTGDTETYPLSAEWTEFPYTQEEWEALFFGGYAPDISIYTKKEFKAVNSRYSLLRMDDYLWIMHCFEIKGTPYVWDLYRLFPEDAMGMATWTCRPNLSSVSSRFSFTFDVPASARIVLSTMDGQLFDSAGNAAEGYVLELDKAERSFYWSAFTEEAVFASGAKIDYSVELSDGGYAGSIYITGDLRTDSGCTYTARPVGAFLIMQKEDGAYLSTAPGALPISSASQP